MKNMYEILDRMNLLEGKGSKPDFLDLDKDGNKKEPMKSAAKDVDESALQAYLGKKKYGETGMKALQKAGRDGASKERMASIRAKHDKMDEAEMEEGNEFSGELTKARAQGAKSFKVDGKEYPVKEDQIDELDMKLLKGLQGAMSKNQKDSESERNIHKKYGYRSDRDDTGNDDDYDEYGNLKDKKKAKSKDDGPKKKGRPAGTGRKLGAKGPTGKSKLLRMKEDEMISLVDKGEYDREGDMAREQLHTAAEAAKELHDILDADENLPEWVQSKITKALDYLDTARDYMKASDAEDGEEVMPERKLSKPEMNKREKYVKSMKKSKGDFEKRYGERGEEVMYATATKMAKKKGKEETEESTVAGSVATAPAGGKAAKGMQFGKGVYEGQIAESFERKLNMITEGMSINMSVGEDGTKSLSVNATDEDAEQLAMILKMAGLGSQKSSGCGCGTTPCSCEQMEEDYSNSPDTETQSTDYMTKTIAGGLNKPKRDVAGNGQTTVPVSAVRVQEEADIESHLTNLYKQFKAQ
jgi:hypothetical protein